MLFLLILLRVFPMAVLRFVKERKTMKLAVAVLILCYGILFGIASWRLFAEKNLMALVYIPISMFPHYICYGFSVWILLRCLWQEWSERVWKRIYKAALFGLMLGALMEAYWNPPIVQFFLGL